MNDLDPMSPDASPAAVTKKSGVRRVNNLPLYLMGAGLAAFLGIMVLVAIDRAAQQNQPAELPASKGGSSSTFAKQLADEHKEGIIPAKPVKVPDMAMASVAIARPDTFIAPPAPPSGELVVPRDEHLERIRQAKMQQFEEAVKAKTSVGVVQTRSKGSSDFNSAPATPISRDETLARLAAVRQKLDAESRNADPTTAYKERMELLGASGASPASAAPQSILASTATTRRNDIGQFGSSGQTDRWKSDSEIDTPRSPFQLRAGSVVPGTLISGINSDLPGQIIAQVSQNVYDTATGKHLLLPQGARLVGTYSSEVIYGQSSILIAWQRIVFPDGKAFDIGSMPGANSAGYAGFKDQVNNHYFRIFSSALLMSVVTGGISLSQNRNQNIGTGSAPTASSALSEALGQQLGQVTAQMIAKNINISPTLDIRPGYRFNVMVTKDMTFSKPYQSFDY